jgi:hypothetical protein
VATVAAVGLCAPSAVAGSYDVLSCSIDGGFYPNNAWVAGNSPAPNTAYSTDTTCAKAGDPLAVALAANTAYGNGTYAGLFFYAPPQTTITNYKVSIHHYWFAPPLPNYPTERTYTTARLGDYPFSGTGLWLQRDQDPLANEGHWYGYRGAHQSGAADTGVITANRGGSAYASSKPDATYMVMLAGCYTDDGSACSLGTDGNGNVGTAFLQLFGSRVTVTDNTPPNITTIASGSGLLASGTRSGDEPLTFSATDNVGIRRAEIVDVTDASNPTVVAATDYNDTPTAQKAQCSYTRPRPCPDVKDQTIAAPTAIAGKRTILLRVTDAAGNETVSSPYAITARGPVNGSGGGDGARVVAGFLGHTMRGRGKSRHRVGVLRPSKTVRWGHRAIVRGILRNASAQPISGAQLRLLVRELKLGSHYADRGSVTTGADGRFVFGITKGSSRRFRVAYRAYAGDDRLTAKSDVTFNTKARITVHVPRRVRSRGTVRFRGRLPGRPLPPNGVTLELQAHQPGRGWRTVKTTRTRRGGRYSTRYRFNSASGRFTFRIRLRPSDSYPYARGTSKAVRVRVG